MAATNPRSSQGIANLGKLVVDQIWTANATPVAAFNSFRRAVHSSVYDKNLEDNVHPSRIADDLIQPPSDKYWSPDPETGVFGPARNHYRPGNGSANLSGDNGSSKSTLQEENAWFRHSNIEDMEKPHGN